MKRLLTATAALLLTGGLLTATAAELPDVVKNRLASVQEKLEKTKTGTQNYAELSARYAALSAYPETFDKFLKTATDAYNKAGGDLSKLPAIIDGMVLWETNSKYLTNGWAYSKKNGLNNPHWSLFASRIGMSETEELDGLIKIFLRANDYDAWIFKHRMQRFAILLSAKPETEAKAVLKQINRVISPKLSIDKERWEPAVVMIRTMLETY